MAATDLEFKYWGKARPLPGAASHHPLVYHSLDVAAVGVAFLELSCNLHAWLTSRLNAPSGDAALSWVAFWLAIHDLGKFSISFQGQVPDLVEQLRGELPAKLGLPHIRHDSLGLQLWDSRIAPAAERECWFGDDPDSFVGMQFWARAVMGHHGQPPIEGVPRPDLHFHPQDQEAAESYVRGVRKLLLTEEAASIPARHDSERFLDLSTELSWWMAGLAVLSDWIGSNAEIFEYRAAADLSLTDYWDYTQKLAHRAVQQSGVLPPPVPTERAFAELFPSIKQPSPLQEWARGTSIQRGQQIHLLEDVTGAGKTEAAVTLAHRLMAADCADGFFIGLPTMATANAMYGRIADVLDRLFEAPVSLALAHRNKRLVEDFAQSILPPGADERDKRQRDESATRRCTRWLADHNKRALLAPAGVGTIDQALLGALQSKHQSLRLLGLLRKVLVVDEVHACDAYMQETLERLLEFHARAGGSAVLLSATMTERMKNALLRAFARGCGQRVIPAVACGDYPLTTSWTMAQRSALTEVRTQTRPDVKRTVRVRYCAEQAEVIKGITQALAAGQCVAWIRNTVGDAMEAYAKLSALIGPEHIDLFHARFALGDRLDIEDRVLTRFGRDSGPAQRAGRLLIATQVAEQSLDIDLDLVISDLAPIDRLIQRAGRLRRHVRDAAGQRLRDPGAADLRGEPWMWVLGPAWTDAPTASWFRKASRRGSAVYPNHGHLWLTAKFLQEGRLAMPDDARRLIEGVFGDVAAVPQGLEGNTINAEGGLMADRSKARQNSVKLDVGYVRCGLDWSEDTVAPSRLGEETIEVLLGRWDGDRLLPWRNDKPAQHAWAYSTVRVAKRLISGAAPEPEPSRAAAVASALEAMPGGGKWVVLLALDPEADGYFGPALSAKNGAESIERWQYDSSLGLVKESPDRKASEDGSP